MISWNDISLFAFQNIERINALDWLDDTEKVLHTTCEAFGISEDDLDNMPVKKANKKIAQLVELMKTPPVGEAKKRMGPYDIIYDPGEIKLGQFIELRYFSQDHIQKGHLVMASLAKPAGKPFVS